MRITAPRRSTSAAAIALLAGLLGLSHARGESPALRGIAADVAAGRLLDDTDTEDTRNDEADAELATLAAQQQRAAETLKTRVRTLYRVTRAGIAPVSGGFDAVRLHVARVRRMTLLVKSDLHTLQAIESRTLTIKTRLAQQSEARTKSAAELIAAHPLRPRAGEVVGANADPAADEPMPAPSGGFYGMRFSQATGSTGFAAKQGRLATPVAGEFRIVDARRSESEGSGIEFQAPPGTSVRAVAAGRVAFSDRYGSYGRLIIVDHGDTYYTAYGGLGSVEVRVGDELSAFARIGSIAANSGGGSALYFELRKGTKTLPPRPWLGQ